MDGGGFRSSMEMLAPWDRRWRVVLRPRPEEPPDIMKVRSLRCMLSADLVEFDRVQRKQKGERREALEVQRKGASRKIVGISM